MACFQVYLPICVYFSRITSDLQWEINMYSVEYLSPATWKEAKCFSSIVVLRQLKKNSQEEGKRWIYKIPPGFYMKRGQKANFPPEQ